MMKVKPAVRDNVARPPWNSRAVNQSRARPNEQKREQERRQEHESRALSGIVKKPRSDLDPHCDYEQPRKTPRTRTPLPAIAKL